MENFKKASPKDSLVSLKVSPESEGAGGAGRPQAGCEAALALPLMLVGTATASPEVVAKASGDASRHGPKHWPPDLADAASQSPKPPWGRGATRDFSPHRAMWVAARHHLHQHQARGCP